MKLSISARLVILVALLVTATAATISYYLYQSGLRILVDHALQDLTLNVQRDGDRLSSHIEELKRDVLFLSSSPPVPGLIRAKNNRGYDPIGQSSNALWQQRLASQFTTLLSTNPDYMQARLLDAHGRELIKANRDGQDISLTPQQALQDKSATSYFRQIRALPTGSLYLSSIDLNREFNQISLPHTLVLRCATPVFDKGKLFAILIINLNFSHLLKELEKTYGTAEQTLYVTNHLGAYLSHPDPSKRFGFELGHHFRIQEDFPLLADLFAPSNREASRNIIPTDPHGKIMVFVKLPLTANHPDRFIAVGLNRTYSAILEQETKILKQSFTIIILFILLSIFLALGFGHLLVRPLKQIAGNLEAFASGERLPLPVKRSDEIGTLARALESMADNVFSSHQQLRKLNARLEDEVEERTEEVRHNLRLLNTISQAQTAFIGEPSPQQAFEIMLAGLLEVGDSEYGFIGEVLHQAHGAPYFKSHVISNIAWDEQTRKTYADNLANGLEFLNLDSLIGQVMVTEQPVFSNEPTKDPRRGGLPQGHPPLNAFLGVPLFSAGKLVGMAGIANRAAGYDATVLQQLEPFITTCANMIASIQTRNAAQQKDIELQQTRSELERVTNISPVIFYVTRAYGDYGASFVSPNIKSLMGYEPAECLADPSFWRDNIYPDDRERVFAELNQIYETGHHTHSYRFRNKNGDYRWVQDDLQLIRDEHGEPRELAGYWLDISERKQAELALHESEIRFRSIIRSSPMGIFIYKLVDDQLIVTDYNPAADKILGVDCKRFVGQTIEQAFPSTAGTESIAHLKRAAREGIPWGTEDVFYDNEANIAGAFEVHVFQTEPNTLAVMFMDITERKQAQNDLSRFKSTLDQTQDCVFMFSADTLQYFYVNQGAMFLVGYSETELIQRYAYDLNNRVNTEEEFRAFVKPLLDGSQASLMFETEYRCKDQTLVPVEVILQYITHEGQAPRFVAMVRDITERRKIDRMKNEFVSTVSHELRTPLTSIRGALGLITGGAVGDLPEHMQQMLQIAGNNTERLLLLINDILDIQKIESGQLNFRFTPITVMDLLEQAVRDNSSYAEQYHVRFEIIHRKDNVHVLGDRDRLMQVLSNLMSNAAKFSPAGGVVELGVAQHSNAIRISVTDHGPGIAEDFQPRLFEQFTQSDASDTRQKGGTGLGLSIVKAIIDKHGGRVDYITRSGLGTTMFFELPICRAETQVETNTLPIRLGTHRPCLLLLEDDPDIAILLKRLLSGAGYNCDIAYTAAEARQLLRTNITHYKAMTLDIQLPDIDGVAFINELRANPATRSLPVIVVSVEADAARQRLNGGAIGIVDWLDKPIDQQRLLNALATSTQAHGKPRLLHIEDETDVRKIVAQLLKDKVKLSWADNLQQARDLLAEGPFELILLDISLPDGSGLSLLAEIEQHHPASKLVIYSAHELAPQYLQQVHAVLTKSVTDNDTLLHTIETLLATNQPSGS